MKLFQRNKYVYPDYQYQHYQFLIIKGSVLSANGNITKGRNQGIVFCTENPKECNVEYQYIKLIETQK